MYLIDTNILIDYLRLHKPAIEFLDNLPKEDRNIGLISQMELIQGCKKKANELTVNLFLKNFKILPLSSEISAKALKIYRTYKWASKFDIPDSFIAANALLNKLTLVTRNIKHFKNIASLKIEKPY